MEEFPLVVMPLLVTAVVAAMTFCCDFKKLYRKYVLNENPSREEYW